MTKEMDQKLMIRLLTDRVVLADWRVTCGRKLQELVYKENIKEKLDKQNEKLEKKEKKKVMFTVLDDTRWD